ncbi:MAG: CRISPR-associated endonuclease Cas3'', partial [Candidatus Marinimicrobia bacterium]|nr:CRISPR-associated endonuclease Cas3'' [Candidatus Neomarinimicrobiota bacterium]
MKNAAYFRYWGKTEKYGERYHLLPYHCLDVAAVEWYLLAPEKPLCQRLAAQFGVEPIWLQKFFVFCLALHDIGKFARAFQGLRQGMSPDLVKANSRMSYSERHDTLGFWLWRKHLISEVSKLYPDNSSWLNKIEPWLEIVTGHHGMPPKKSGGRMADFYESEDEEAATLFVQDISGLFLSAFDYSPLLDKTIKQRLKTISWQLAGVAVLADWVGSNQDYFKYCIKPMPMPDYWITHALPSAEKAIKA